MEKNKYGPYVPYILGILFAATFLASAFLYNENRDYERSFQTFQTVAKYQSKAASLLAVIGTHMSYERYDEASALMPQLKDATKKMYENADILYSQTHPDAAYLIDAQAEKEASNFTISGLEKFIDGVRIAQLGSGDKLQLSDARNKMENAKIDFQSALESLSKIKSIDESESKKSLQNLISTADQFIASLKNAA